MAVGGLVIEVGGASETVDVTAEAPLIQASSGERSFTVTTESVENLPLSNRNFASLTQFTPGVTGTTTRLGGGGQNNIMMDGVSTMDTGNNGQMIAIEHASRSVGGKGHSRRGTRRSTADRAACRSPP